MRFAFTLFLIGFSYSLLAQELSVEDKVLNQKTDECLSRIYTDDKSGLRYLPEFLDNETQFTRVRRNGTSKVTTLRYLGLSILYNNCYFEGLPFDENITAKAVEAYLDEHYSEIQYRPEIGRFTNINFEQLSYPYRLRAVELPTAKDLKTLIAEIEDQIKKEDYVSMIPLYWQIAELQTPKAEKYLLKAAQGKNWPQDKCGEAEKVLSGIAYALGSFRTQKAFGQLVKLYQDYELFAVEDWLKAMARVTNIDVLIETRDPNQLGSKYEELMDSLKTIEQFREYGYQKFMNAYDIESFDPVKIVQEIEFHWWVYDNLMKDLLEKEDPLVLYLSALRLMNELYVYNDKSKDRMSLFDAYYWAEVDLDMRNRLRKLTGVEIELQVNGEWVSEPESLEEYIALLNYWKKHYKEYTFNKSTGFFEHPSEKVLPLDQLKLYFEQMHQEDAELALQAYRKLIEEDPKRVLKMMRNFDMDYISGTLNDALPMFTRRFLTQQALLVDFARENGLSSWPEGQLLDLLEQVRTDNYDFAEQIDLEGKLMQQLSVNNILAVENYTITYGSRNDQLANVVGHVLDQWYSAHLEELIADSLALRSYLYKAERFDGLGIVGVVNNYLRKMDRLPVEQLAPFKALLDDSLEVVRKNARWVLDNNPHVSTAKVAQDSTAESPVADNSLSFEQFLQQPGMDEARVKRVVLDTSSEKALAPFFSAFQAETNPEILFKFVVITDENLHINMLPHLLQLMDKEEVLQTGRWGATDTKGKRHTINFEAYTNDYATYLIERIYDYYNEAPRPAVFKNNFVSSSHSGPVFLINNSCYAKK